LVTYSEDFSNADWLKVGVGSGVAPIVTSDQGIAPDGTMSADRVQLDVSASSGDRSILRQLFSALSTTGKITFYAKSNTGSNQYVLYHDETPEAEATITTEWQRFEFESDGTGRRYFGIQLRNGISTQNTADILLWGFQVEDVDSYPTSYIPTTSAAVTRNADSCELTGVADLIGDSEGTYYAEITNAENEASIFSITDGSNNNSLYVNINTSGNYAISLRNLSSNIVIRNTSQLYSKNDKVAVKLNSTSLELWVNSVKVQEETFASISDFNFTNINVGRKQFSATDKVSFSNKFIFPTALTDTQLENLTS